MDQVRAWVGRLDATDLASVVAALVEHDLRVDLLDDRRVRVSLAIDPKALGGPRIVATASARVPVSVEGGVSRITCNEWAAREKPHPCACGCGENVAVKPIHRWKGVPRYVQGHHNAAAAAKRWTLPEGEGEGGARAGHDDGDAVAVLIHFCDPQAVHGAR